MKPERANLKEHYCTDLQIRQYIMHEVIDVYHNGTRQENNIWTPQCYLHKQLK